jgi:hypothetical protein
MPKKHSPRTSKLRTKRMVRPQTETERLAIKVQNNDDCPCGKTRPREIFTTEGTKIVEIPVKYKKCCKGVAFFYATPEDQKLAEEDFNRRNPKKYNEIVEEVGVEKLNKKIENDKKIPSL